MEAAVCGALYVLLVLALVPLAMGFKAIAPEHTHFLERLITQSSVSPLKPIDFALITLSLIILIPAAVWAVRFGGRREVGHLFSVEGTIRRQLLWKTTQLILPIYLVSTVIPLFFFDHTYSVSGTALIGMVLVIILIPLQASAEEIVFRGLMGQILGAWMRSPIGPIVLPVVFFLLAHGYNWLGMVALGIFSICMGILAWVTGGLEIPMVMHAVSNMTALLPICFGAGGISDDVSAAGVIYQSVLTIALTALVIYYPRVVGVTSWQTSTRP
ncbi:hypothetical protein AUCHE_04_00270 [Austwickia chelonae NBRC 105200]|uniref:CAAX prenyl protease 2/Lysostaphin resistance protein A-like domain-containing protein n=1 Tax=Austwickia chelonae NBRC 105200 TaxID=1184607 RepID=K6W5A8_9MICO|nr:hypothetical protein AUCHE_04_00270 [Austwickia chelonae NBRC 105200]